MITKKNYTLLFLILVLILVIAKKTDFFKNLFNVSIKSHDQRQQEANNFCDLLGSGYVFYIKKKFNLKNSPIIKNSAVEQYWIFSSTYKILDENKIIVLNNKKQKIKNFKGFKVLDNFQNRCLYLVKND